MPLFRDTFITTAMALGNNATRAAFLADFLLPDILTLDTSNTGGFPNGRRLEDDVIDTALNLVSNGAITRDCAANDIDLPDHVPVLGRAESLTPFPAPLDPDRIAASYAAAAGRLAMSRARIVLSLVSFWVRRSVAFVWPFDGRSLPPPAAVDT